LLCRKAPSQPRKTQALPELLKQLVNRRKERGSLLGHGENILFQRIAKSQNIYTSTEACLKQPKVGRGTSLGHGPTGFYATLASSVRKQ
jgi:hypothetical protein